MNIHLNGEPHKLQDKATIADAIKATGASPDQRGIAVAIDAEVIPRSAWQTTTIQPNQKVEVLHATQGG